MNSSNLNPSILSAALEGLELKKQQIENQIAEVRSMLGSGKSGSPAAAGQGESQPAQRKTRGVRSAAVRKRMAEAQRRRWEAVRRAKEAPAKAAPATKKAAGKKAAKKAVKKAGRKTAGRKTVTTAASGGSMNSPTGE